MSEPEEQKQEQSAEESKPQELCLQGLFAFKKGMSHVYDESGALVPVTVLTYEPNIVSQLKTNDKDGYTAVQVAFRPKRAARTGNAERNHLAKAGFENGAAFVREVRQDHPEGIAVGQKVSLNSLAKGDKIKVRSKSKGRGFAGVMKRYDFGGGRATHGSGTHRRTGSIGMCEFPGRVLPGKKMPGHYGHKNFSVRNLQVVDVLPDEQVILVKGSVPGARNTLVEITKA